MRSRPRMLVLAWLVIASAGWGCSSEQGSETAVPASISGGGGSSASRGGPARPKTDPLHPVVEIRTSLGTITVRLDAENAPGTVSNFLNYVNSGQYDRTIFHHVEPGAMILSGGFSTDRKPIDVTTSIRNEAHNGVKNERGTIAMSRHFESIDSATSQFFINAADNPTLDYSGDGPDEYGYCVFGKVTKGMEVVDGIAGAEVHDQGEFVSTPREQVVIESIRLVD